MTCRGCGVPFHAWSEVASAEHAAYCEVCAESAREGTCRVCRTEYDADALEPTGRFSPVEGGPVFCLACLLDVLRRERRGGIPFQKAVVAAVARKERE